MNDTEMEMQLSVGNEIRDGVQRALDKAKAMGMDDTEKCAVLVCEMMIGPCMILAYQDVPKEVAMAMIELNYDKAMLKWAERAAQKAMKQ